MKKKDIRNMSRNELVDLVFELSKDTDDEFDFEIEDAPTGIVEERKRIKNRRRFLRTLRSTVAVLVVVAAIAVLVSMLFLPVIQVSGSSMEPTLCDGDIIVLFKSGTYETGELCCFSWQNKLLLKRVIGVAGDYIDIDQDGYVSVNGQLLDEPYVTDRGMGECDIELPYQVPDGKVFVMGDSREKSIDSRSSVVGCIDKEQMVGKVLIKIWSTKRDEE